jgi:hypothetical protein
MEKIGDIKVMFWGAVVCLPYITSLLIPAFKSERENDDGWYFSSGFVYTVILIVSLINGIGEGMA